MTVWTVEHCESDGPGITVAIYDNEQAAVEHAASWDDMVLGGFSSALLRVRPWSVQTEPMEIVRR